jgi:hypothetical protein
MNQPRKRSTELAHDVPWMRTCVFCEAEMDAQRWAELPLVKVLDRSELQSHLSVSVAWNVEVRRCTCGALIASVGRHLAV